MSDLLCPVCGRSDCPAPGIPRRVEPVSYEANAAPPGITLKQLDFHRSLASAQEDFTEVLTRHKIPDQCQIPAHILSHMLIATIAVWEMMITEWRKQ